MMELHILNREGTTLKSYALGERNEVLVGRDESCDIRIKSRAVSREHCAIEADGESVVVRDLGSSGGTFVDGERIEAAPVRSGMEVAIGPAILRFLDAEI